MHLRDFFNLDLLENIMKDWSKATGLATIAVDNEGQYISSEIGFTDFCMKYTRGSAEGARRCVKCDNECTGTYFCHAGLMDFSVDIMVGDTYLGKIIGGQVLPEEPDEDKFRELAAEFGVDPDEYIAALRQIPVKSEESIRASAKLLGDIVNMLVNFEYVKSANSNVVNTVTNNIDTAVRCIEDINNKSKDLDKIENNQKILALNASIEAARAGDAGRGFAIVAGKVGDLAANSGEINRSIKDSLKELTTVINELAHANQ
ncbi:MAG: PocR ligand-binding domain-containing protein [Lachnospiraceae bacterium]|nr:PocR ligand-binding domain-containing protein [Lachnospiraceae bacterium]